MTLYSFKTFGALGAASLITTLSACGGGDGAPVTAPPPGGGDVAGVANPNPPNYETLASNAAQSSTVGIVGLESNNSTSAIVVTQATGTLDHATGHLTVTSANFTFASDANGFQNPGTTTDGNGNSVTVGGASGFSGSYDYVVPFNANYTVSGTSYDLAGMVGGATDASDLASSGTASYNGEAVAGVIDGNGATTLSDGTSLVTVDFTTQTVNVVLNGFSTSYNGTGTPSGLTEIQITGMTISGNSFSGGNVTYIGDPNPTGAGSSFNAAGQFYGYDASISAPDEVAGVLLQTGADGTVTASFIAD